MDYAQIPHILLTDPAVQRAYDAAAHNLLAINTIPCDFSAHNAAGLLDASVPFLIRAGGAYDTPWTRDSAINTWAAGRLYVPTASKNTLLAVCTLDENGDPIILPDNQVWDRIVWAVGAWQYYLATGDEEFLTVARGIVERGLNVLHKERFDTDTGLYRGGSFFNDGISGYPADIYEPGMDHSFMGMHPKTETIMCLSTNCIYCEAWNILWKMNRLLGIDDPIPAARRDAMKEAILHTFWNPETRTCAYLRYPDGRLDNSQELAGISFGVLFGILPTEALWNVQREKFGVPSILPPFPGLFSREKPGRHNNLVWPFLNGFYIQAAANAGLEQVVSAELAAMTELLICAEGIYEIYNPYNGGVDGGWQIGGDDLQGHLWDSCPDQTWSATSYMGALIHGIFGVDIQEDGIAFIPCVPENLKDSAIENLTIRGRKYNLRLQGWGKRVVSAAINGQTAPSPYISFEEAGEYNEIILYLQ